MDQTLSVALYARVSSQRQAEELTIGSQVEMLQQRIRQDGYVVADELCFLDDGYSGSTLVRPALERLRDVAHCGGLDRLYLHSPDRLARKYLYQMLLLDEFAKQSVQVIFLNHDPQHQSAEGELLLQMQGMIAEYERAKILERTRRGRRFAARQGKISVLTRAPYGYRYVSKREGDGEARYDILLEEARLVRELYQWVGLEGLSLSEVAQRLMEQGIPTATGKPRWDRATIRGLLCNPAYTGTAKYGKTRLITRVLDHRPKRGDPPIPRQSKVSRATSPEDQESIPVPALVSCDLFQAAAERLELNRRRNREQKNGAEYLLSGLLVCHRCGSAYCGRRKRDASGHQQYVYYRCLGTDKYRQAGEAICTNKGMNGSLLETAIWSDVCSLLEDPERLRHELQRRCRRSPTADVDNARHEEAIGRIKRRLTRLIDAYESGWVEKDDFEVRMRRAKERLVREQETVAEYQRTAADDEQWQLLVGDFQKIAGQIAIGLEQSDLATRRKILRFLINRIEVDEKEIRIVYKVQPRPFDLGPGRGNLQHCLKRLGPAPATQT
jgi:site-specific DNA recombinase